MNEGEISGVQAGQPNIEAVAKRLFLDFLAFWSASNVVALQATPNFYAPSILYYGRRLSSREVFGEKLRFVRRWPDRRYVPKPETIEVSCTPATTFCMVRSVFEFTATNNENGRRSEGTGLLELGIRFAGSRPLITEERSQVVHRHRSALRQDEHAGL